VELSMDVQSKLPKPTFNKVKLKKERNKNEKGERK
jgi:hypothetical protein